jgi:signal transduction histidine kinase
VPHPTIRLRLTLWYGGLFLLAGGLLLSANFVLVERNFPAGRQDLFDAVAQRMHIPSEALMPGRTFPVEPARPGGPRFPATDLLEGVRAELRNDTLTHLAIQSGVALAVMAVVSMGLGWVVAGRMLRPLREISDTVHRISDQNLSERIAMQGPRDELRELADHFDVMLERLQMAFDAQRDFVANASHELRTPLTIIRTELDVVLSDGEATGDELQAMADVLRRATGRADRLIDQLLFLTSAGQPVERTDALDLAAVARQAGDSHQRAIAGAQLRAELSLAPAPVMGAQPLIERLVGNLIENAIQHNEPGGWIEVATEANAEGATMLVSNGGPQIADQDVARIFDRFSRLDRSRSRETGGYGLGLSIVRAIARGHGGNATARALPGGGLELAVQLPR